MSVYVTVTLLEEPLPAPVGDGWMVAATAVEYTQGLPTATDAAILVGAAEALLREVPDG